MKQSYKITVLLLMIVCVAMMTCACESNSESNVPYTNQTESLIVDRPLFTIEDYEEYLSFLELTDLPADFVTFDSLQIFGSFENFVDLTDLLNSDEPYNCYSYSVIDENGYRYSIDVSREERLVTSDVLNRDDINLSDMRILSSKQRGVYTINGFTYRYVNGRLSSIRWYSQGMHYALFISAKDFEDYPIESSTPFAKLVNINDDSTLLMDYLLN